MKKTMTTRTKGKQSAARRMLVSVCVLAMLIVGQIGCTKSPPPDAAVADASDLPNIIKSLQEATSPIGRRSVLKRLQAIGPAANTPEVLKALEEARKKGQAVERPVFDETLAKIKAAAPKK